MYQYDYYLNFGELLREKSKNSKSYFIENGFFFPFFSHIEFGMNLISKLKSRRGWTAVILKCISHITTLGLLMEIRLSIIPFSTLWKGKSLGQSEDFSVRRCIIQHLLVARRLQGSQVYRILQTMYSTNSFSDISGSQRPFWL